jgi:hypothetical protein
LASDLFGRKTEGILRDDDSLKYDIMVESELTPNKCTFESLQKIGK